MKCRYKGPAWVRAKRVHGGTDHRAVAGCGVIESPDPASRPAGCAAPVADRGLRVPDHPGRAEAALPRLTRVGPAAAGAARAVPGQTSGARSKDRKTRQAGEELLRVAAALAVTGSRSGGTGSRSTGTGSRSGGTGSRSTGTGSSRSGGTGSRSVGEPWLRGAGVRPRPRRSRPHAADRDHPGSRRPWKPYGGSRPPRARGRAARGSRGQLPRGPAHLGAQDRR